MKINCVFEGGGVLGISFAGAYKALQEGKHEIIRCAGTSAGSIISALIIAGYSSNEIIDIIESTDFKQFLKKTKASKLFLVGKPLSIVLNNGIYDSSVIEEWMEKLLIKKGISTFQDVMENGVSRLKIVAADITNRRMLMLPDDLKDYGIDPKTFSIAKAVRMSCAIPYFFTPVTLKQDNEIHYIVDGGLLSTFPIWAFDMEKTDFRPTIGFKIKDDSSLTSLGKNGILAFTKDLINAPINMDETYFVQKKDIIRIVIIANDGKIKATDFKLKRQEIKKLFQDGYNSTLAFFVKWNFAQYVKTFM